MIGFLGFCALLVAITAIGVFVRLRDRDLDYPEAHGRGLNQGQQAVQVLGTNLSWSGINGSF